jgi:tetratricopeptide (TPR) repeat protein
VATRAAQLAQHAGAALTRWQEAVRYADQSPATLRSLARLARLWQDDSAAEIAAKTMLRLRPQSPWANRELRDLYFSRGDTAKLLAHYSAWLAVEPDRPALVFGWVRAAAALHRVDEAMDRRTAALAAAPERPALIDLARVLALWQRTPQAARALWSSTAPRAQGLHETTLVAALVMEDHAAVAILATNSQDLLPEERVSLKLLTSPADKRRE